MSNRDVYRQNAKQMIDLVRCAVNSQVPTGEMLEGLDLDALFHVCQSHILTACTAYALESAGIHDKQFAEAKNKSIRKSILLETDCKMLTGKLEAAGIWYMPLKGAVLKNWYPKIGMRQMSDYDILYDAAYRGKVKEIMLESGFKLDHYDEIDNVDAYMKPPVCNFEMHHSLFRKYDATLYYEYFEFKSAEMLLPDTDSTYGRHFSAENFYLYFIAHEYKHYQRGGTGVRSLADTYIMLKRFESEFDWDYLQKALKALEMDAFEKQNRELAMHLFSGETLSQEEAEELDYYIDSGTYGQYSTKVKHEIAKNGSKKEYIFHRIFPPMEWIQIRYPFFYRHKLLLPFLWIYRLIHGFIVHQKQFRTELKTLRETE